MSFNLVIVHLFSFPCSHRNSANKGGRGMGGRGYNNNGMGGGRGGYGSSPQHGGMPPPSGPGGDNAPDSA